jgi:outer membrane protein assembly factor BamB
MLINVKDGIIVKLQNYKSIIVKEKIMRVSKKWFSYFSLFVLIFSLFSGVSVEASTTKLPIFYKDPVKMNCEYCNAQLHTAPNGTVYQYSYESSKITAISAAGKKIWTYKFPKNTFLSYKTGLTSDGKGNIYFGIQRSNFYYLVSLNSKGAINWEYKMENHVGPSTPIVDKDGTVYFGSGNPTDEVGPFGKSYFYSVSSKGKQKWRITLNGDAMFSVIQFDKSQNLVLPTTNEEVVWNYTISKTAKIISAKESNSFSSIAWNDFFIDTKTLTLKSVDKKGKILWSYKVFEDTAIKYVTTSGTVVLESGGDTLAINKGKVIWKLKGRGDVIPNKKGLFLIDKFSGNMEIKILDEKTGKVKFSKKLDSDFYQYTVHPNGSVLVSKGNVIYKAF